MSDTIQLARKIEMKDDSTLIKERDRVAGVDKAAQVVAAFGADRGSGFRSGKLTLADVAAATGLSRAAARRYVLTLLHLGYVQNYGKLYSLTPKVLELGQQYCHAMSRLPAYQTLCSQLSRALGEASSVAILHHQQAICVAFNSADHYAPVWVRAGQTLPAYACAAGRLLLSNQDEASVASMLQRQKLEKFTPHTLATSSEILAQIAVARELGFACDEQEIELGVRSLAIGLKNESGHVVAALSLHIGMNRVALGDMVQSMLPKMRQLQSLVGRDVFE
jgi:IclR family transcriptional regulator, pca regulon regulatory protein